jgi:hypothetical protein
MKKYSSLSDSELLAEVGRLAQHERRATAQLIASLVELDLRRLYLGEGCASLFTYCTQVLRLSEGAAYGRIQAARAAARFPLILDRLVDGSLNLTTVGLLAPHLTEDNHSAVLEGARGKSKREVELQVAALRPRCDVATSVRKLPIPRHHGSPPMLVACDPPQSGARDVAPPPRPAIVAPLAPERFQISVTVSRETHDKLRRAQNLLRHVVPNGDPAAILDRALTVLLAHLARTKLGETSRPRQSKPRGAHSRHIPAAVRRVVWKRDGGRCAFVGTHGRCCETGLLEFHHVVPFAVGGSAEVDKIELRCAAHNRHEAALYFGPGQPWLLRERPPAWIGRTFEREPIESTNDPAGQDSPG